MLRRLLILVLTALAALLVAAPGADAQFKKDAFSQSYNNDKATEKDTTQMLFSFPEFVGGLKHTREAKMGTMFIGSTVALGAQQIYNDDYWKLPLIYGSILGTAGTGLYFNQTGHKDISKYCFAGTALAYWGTLLDGVLNYEPAPYPFASKATLLSLLCPGLGQAYNHEYYKIPIYCGGLIACLHYYNINSINFQRFRNIYIESTSQDVPYTGPISSETALYYRNIYRTYRDYSLVAFLLVYAIQVIDANVFSFMHDFEVIDDLAMSVSPTLINTPSNQYAMMGGAPSAFGMRFGITF